MHEFNTVNSLAGFMVMSHLGWVCFTVTLTSCFAYQQDKAERSNIVYATSEHGHSMPEPVAELGASTIRPRKQSLTVIPPIHHTRDAETSPFAGAQQSFVHPLADAKELVHKLTESVARMHSADHPAMAQLREGLLQVQSLLNQVSAAQVEMERLRTPGPLSRVSSLFKEAFSFSKTFSSEVDYSAAWPFSDSIPTSFFSHPGPANFKIRGPQYLEDKKKVVPEICQTQLVSMNLLSVREPTYHIARFLPSIKDSRAPFIFVWQIMVPNKKEHISLTIAWALDHDPLDAIKEAMQEQDPAEPADQAPSNQVRNFRATDGQHDVLPRSKPVGEALTGAADTGRVARRATFSEHPERSNHSALDLGASSAKQLGSTPVKGHRRVQSTAPVIDLTSIHEPLSTRSSVVDTTPLDSKVPALAGVQPFDISMARFLDETGDEQSVLMRRHGMFKIIPRIEKGSWLVRQAVGQTPVLLGKKLTTKYFRGPRYIEVDIDISSSSAAAHVVGLVQGSLKSLTIDLAVLLEGRSQEELPESLLGTVRLQNLDLSKAAELDPVTGRITKKI